MKGLQPYNSFQAVGNALLSSTAVEETAAVHDNEASVHDDEAAVHEEYIHHCVLQDKEGISTVLFITDK